MKIKDVTQNITGLFENNIVTNTTKKKRKTSRIFEDSLKNFFDDNSDNVLSEDGSDNNVVTRTCYTRFWD